MAYRLTNLYAASALGVGNHETLTHYFAGEAPGLRELAGDIPNRTVWFGQVLGDVPPATTRTNSLLQLAIEQEPAFRDLVARYGAARVGIVLGASNTGVHEAQAFVDTWLETPAEPPPSAFDFSMLELGSPALYLRERLGVKGPAYTISTACSSATKAFGAARRLIASGRCDAVITGGVDGRCRFALNGFHALGALSEGRCRPLAPDRDGINLGEAVALFTLEKTDVGGVRLCGVGESSDAYHATAPNPEGLGAEASMRAALADAGLTPQDIDYINLHGTGTQANDAMELKAVARVFGTDFTAYESTKRFTGHCLGAAGAIEAAICMLLIQAGRCRCALSNSFAFGGSNAGVILSA